MAGEEGAIFRALQAGAAVEEDLPTIGFLWVNIVKQVLSQPGMGRWYGTHRASAPGQAPAVDTGAYRNSWTHGKVNATTVAMYPQLPAGDDPKGLGGWLEFGTTKMAARPHVRPTNATAAPQIGAVVAAGIERRERRP